MPEFSIIVPVYKVEPYLRQCIDSILAQTCKDFELILVDDGSPDNCGGICDEYAQMDARVKVIHKPNGGLVSARKAGIKQSSGEYIVNVDGDDYIGCDLLQTIGDIITECEPDIVAFGFKQVQIDGSVIQTFRNALPSNKLYKTQDAGFYDTLVCDCNAGVINYGSIFPSLCTKVAKRKIVMPCMLSVPDEISMGEDLAATNAMLCDCCSVYISDICEYYYRFVIESMTNTFKRDMLHRRQVLFRFMNSHMDKIPQANKDTYACQQMMRHIIDAVRDFDCYDAFLKYIRNEMTPELHEIVDRCKIPKLPLKQKLLFILLKHYAYGCFWLIYHVLKRH